MDYFVSAAEALDRGVVGEVEVPFFEAWPFVIGLYGLVGVEVAAGEGVCAGVVVYGDVYVLGEVGGLEGSEGFV